MASKTPDSQKYTSVDFMEKTAHKKIEKIMRSYLRGLGQEANKVTLKTLVPKIISDELYREYEKKKSTDTDARKAWKNWIGKKSRQILEELSNGNDTTNAPGMDATEGISHAAAVGTAGAEQPPSTEVLLGLKRKASGLYEAIAFIDTAMEECFTQFKSLIQEQGKVKSLLRELQEEMDAQTAGAAARTLMSVRTLGSTAALAGAASAGGRPTTCNAGAVARVALATSSGAKAASKAKIRDNTKMVIDIFDDISKVFCVKYANYPADFSMETRKNHIRGFCRKFLLEDMQKLIAQDRNRTNMTWESAFWLSLLYKFNDQVSQFIAQSPALYEITTEKEKIEERANACKSIFIYATEDFKSKWDIKSSPGGKEDTFDKEIEHISSAFVRLGIACDASKIERPVAVLIKTREKNDREPAKKKARVEPVKIESNGDVTEAEDDDEIVWIESDPE